MSKISRWFFLGAIACILLSSAASVGAVVYPDISGNTTFEWISNVAFGDIDNDSGADLNGYEDYTALSTAVTPGSTYDISVTIVVNAAASEHISVFFDWNQDGDFTDPDESYLLIVGADTAGVYSGQYKIPKDAVSGMTRMRVVLKYNGVPPSEGLIGSGEAEDYTINVISFPWNIFRAAMSAPQNSTPDPVPTFSISSSSFNNNDVIPIQYTLFDDNISPQLSWTNVPAGTANYLLTVFDPDAGNWVHWKVKLAGTVTSLAENAGILGGGNLPAGSVRYLNSFGGMDYDGPRPPAGDGVHHYNFNVIALDAGGAELGSATLIGTYEQL